MEIKLIRATPADAREPHAMQVEAFREPETILQEERNCYFMRSRDTGEPA